MNITPKRRCRVQSRRWSGSKDRHSSGCWRSCRWQAARRGRCVGSWCASRCDQRTPASAPHEALGWCARTESQCQTTGRAGRETRNEGTTGKIDYGRTDKIRYTCITTVYNQTEKIARQVEQVGGQKTDDVNRELPGVHVTQVYSWHRYTRDTGVHIGNCQMYMWHRCTRDTGIHVTQVYT